MRQVNSPEITLFKPFLHINNAKTIFSDTWKAIPMVPKKKDMSDGLPFAFHAILLTPVSYTHLDVYKRQAVYKTLVDFL